MDGITMDGVHYRVRCKFNSLEQSFRIPDGPNAGTMLSMRHERDLGGTFYDSAIAVEPDPRYYADYDQFFQAISAPVDSHSITLPYGQGTMTYDAEVAEGTHRYKGRIGGVERWGGLVVYFSAIRPQRTPE